MRDIEIIDNNTIIKFQKKLWHDTELVLAKCFGFFIDIDSGVILANIRSTHKQAMYEFIRISFKNFSESITESSRKDAFYSTLEEIYASFQKECTEVMRAKLPYFDKLYIHQKDGIEFSMMHRVNFLAYQMRLGKSITSASLSRIFNVKRTVIICPAIAKWGWYRDLTSFWGFNELYFTMLDSAKSKSFYALQERFVIVNYDILNKFGQHIINDEVGHFIIDECHRIKDQYSNRSKVMQKIIDFFPDARITLLSGTAIPNRFNDLFNYFKLVKHPLGESYKKFTDEYTLKTASRGGEKVTGAKNIQDLKLKMLNFMLIKNMDECFDMPDDVVSRYTFDFDDYRNDYNEIIEEMSNEKNIAALRGNLHSLNIITCKSKMKGMIEAIEDIIEEKGKVVVFGSYKEPLALLEKHFGNRCVKVDGSTPSFDRDRYKREFWDNEEVRVFIGNYLAAGEALDLSCASDVFCVNFPFTPRELNQALFRCKHPEKKSHLRIHYTFCKDSIDEYIYEIIVSKEKDINALMTDGKEVLERENIEEILIKKLLNRNEKVIEDVNVDDNRRHDNLDDALLAAGKEAQEYFNSGREPVIVQKETEVQDLQQERSVSNELPNGNGPVFVSDFDNMKQAIDNNNNNGTQIIETISVSNSLLPPPPDFL